MAKKLNHPADVYLLASEVVGYEAIDGKLEPMKMTEHGLLSVSINQAIDDLERHLDAIDEVSP